MPEEQWLRTPQAAIACGVSERTLKRLRGDVLEEGIHYQAGFSTNSAFLWEVNGVRAKLAWRGMIQRKAALEKAPDPWERPDPFTSEECFYLSGCAGNPIEWRHSRADDFFKPLDQKVAVELGKILRRLGYEKDKHQSQGRSGKKRRWRPSGASRRRTTPEAGQTPASDSDAGESSQVSTPFHQKDLNQGEPMAAASTVGKTPERSERRRRR